MSAHRRRTAFAAPFIVVLGCGGGQKPDRDENEVPGEKWTIFERGGECEASGDMGSCPRGAICNPPPPAPAECPPGLAQGASTRVVRRPDATCAVIPSGCTQLSCATETTPCPQPFGTPRKLAGPFWALERTGDTCSARVDACGTGDAACVQAVECPQAADAKRLVQRRGQCYVVPEGCADTSCVGVSTSCPVPAGKDLGALRWLGTRSGDECTVTSTGPIAGELVQKIACPTDPKKPARFQIDRPSRAEPCVYRAGTAPAVTTPCPP